MCWFPDPAVGKSTLRHTGCVTWAMHTVCRDAARALTGNVTYVNAGYHVTG